MFPIKGIRKHVTDKLEEISVLRKYRNGSAIDIIETADNKDDDRKKIENMELLNRVTINNIPTENIWIFENEFGQQKNSVVLINDQKGAFTSSAKKVEKTIIALIDNKFYLFLIELKRSISPRKMQEDVIRKFENSLSTLSVFISAHFDFPQFENAIIYPIGICCYNYYDDNQPTYNRDTRRIAGNVRQKYTEGKREMLLSIEPIGLNRMWTPIIFCQNPNQTTGFDIDLATLIDKAQNCN